MEEKRDYDKEKRWYVVHTYSGYENKVKTNLEHRIESMEVKDKIFQVIVPTEEELEVDDSGHKKTVQKKVFPGYVLVEMIMTDDSWYVVRNTPGVTGFVGTGNKPIPLPDHEVKIILKQVKVEAPPKIKVGYSVGQSVKIVEGPFAEFNGVVDGIDPTRGKVKVLVSLFGRDTPVELDFSEVQRVV
ncbi:MAG: transcription termination/antitermination protein NusG [Chloroflexi bacterium]|nr:transcription termination/antitermination protein NusG [Chloroflexota bacterium]